MNTVHSEPQKKSGPEWLGLERRIPIVKKDHLIFVVKTPKIKFHENRSKNPENFGVEMHNDFWEVLTPKKSFLEPKRLVEINLI